MRSGERCPECQSGRMRVYSVRTVGFSRLRFLRCTMRCGATGQELVPIDDLGRAVILPFRANRSTDKRSESAPPGVSFSLSQSSPTEPQR
jgi:hypothetical protein